LLFTGAVFADLIRGRGQSFALPGGLAGSFYRAVSNQDQQAPLWIRVDNRT